MLAPQRRCYYVYTRVVDFVPVEPDIMVANMCAQNGVRSRKNPVRLNYEALEICLTKVGEYALRHTASVHMPKIGTGLAGAKWKKSF